MSIALKNALFALSLGVGALACQSSPHSPDDVPSGPSTSKPALRAGQNFDGAPSCGVDAAPCEGGLQCATVDLADGAPSSPLCVDPAAACAKLQCSAGECGVLESFPAVITCLAGGDQDPGGDPNGSTSSPPAEYCDERACGEKPVLTPKECPSGSSYAGFVGPCAKTEGGACAWVVFECVTPA